MKVVSFFNNKGGVGKTTLACNIAAHLARKALRVVVVDMDPQCNATILTIGEDRASMMYWDDPQLAGAPNEDAGVTNLWDVLEPIALGEPTIRGGTIPIAATSNRFRYDLIPGHPRVSVIEDKLSQAWRDSMSGDVGGLRTTNIINALGDELCTSYDVMILDLGPSLGSLNRTALLGSDYFVTPMGADVFSILGLRNISSWLREWSSAYLRGIDNCRRTTPDALNRFNLTQSVKVMTGFSGYTVQAYIAKYKQGERRPTRAFERFTSSFAGEVQRSLGDLWAGDTQSPDYLLGEIPNMYSLVPLAQAANAPLVDLRSSDGLVGSHYLQTKRYASILDSVASRLSLNIGISEA